MCGIAANFGTNKNKEKKLLKSLEKIKHRGTNLFEVKVFDGGAIGTNRLPIVGRDSGQQPLTNEDNTIYAILNGEIFNHKELKESLEGKGHKFKTNSDTEVLVHLYEEYGKNMVHYIDSEMYSFVVYDVVKNNFYIARDRFGVKPLYYAKDKNNNLYFGSELKQLSQFNFIEKVYTFPAGHYMYNGKLKKYYELKQSNKIKDLNYAKKELTHLIVESVRKRVDTDLPVAVLFSGGVDSSLIMEIASRFHKDVTAFILGRPGSPDYEAAIRLCNDFNYKYRIVYPDVDYADEFENLIYHLELYEAQVIRQSFALDILSKAIVRAGYKIALSGDASDEIFAGYNEFSGLKDENINKGCLDMTNDMKNGHNMRLDRMSMKHTLEVRVPLFDTKVVDFALKIHGNLKIKRENHQVVTKYILREVAKDFLPDYISDRYKIAFSNGAGMNVGFNFRAQDGEVAESVLKNKKIKINTKINKKYGFITKEEQLYYQLYDKYKFTKLNFNETRIITKDNLTKIEDNSKNTRLLVAEFAKLPLYFPIYLALKSGIYEKHRLDIDFISTGGDDLTYNSLLNGSAQIGIADPIFTFMDNSSNVKGKIIGSLVNRVPLYAVAINPKIKINKLNDFRGYTIGTFQKFSTTNTFIKRMLPDNKIKAIKYSSVAESLKNREIDIAIVIPEYAFEFVQRGGHIIYSFESDFKEYLFTGISTSNNIDPKYNQAVKSFTASIKESINFIKKNKKESLIYFKKEFPELSDHEETLDNLSRFWNKKLIISSSGIYNATETWRKIYPWLLKSKTPQFIEPRLEDKIIEVFSARDISRDIPYKEDDMANLIKSSINHKRPISLIGFWGLSDKKQINQDDLDVLNKFKKLDHEIRKIYKHGLEFTFILSDEHALLNNYKESDYQKYLFQIKKEMKKNNFKIITLSSLWDKHNISSRKVSKYLFKLSDTDWKSIPVHRKLEDSSKKRGHKKYKDKAKEYFVVRKLEAEVLKKEFKDSIFHTYSEDINQVILPDMPTIYLWTLGRGVSSVPWFLN